MNLTEHLRANPDLVSLDRATLYLASRVRTRTPFGAAEYLEHRQHAEPVADSESDYGKRCELALTCAEIYRSLFPGEWANSTAPYLSLQREQELYRLVHQQCFPLMIAPNDIDLTVDDFIRGDPQFCLGKIPMRGVQRFLWVDGQFDWREIPPAFRLALAFSRQIPACGWERIFEGKMPGLPTPSRPLAAVGWSLFNYSCMVEESPLVHFPLAFHFITYKTGNPWVDLPRIGFFAFHWSLSKVAELAVTFAQAEQMSDAITELSDWFEEDPVSRVGRAIELWNDAAAKEQQSGGEGLLRDEQTGQFYRREDWF